MARGYFTTPISDHLEEMPDGSLVARDAVIARTGFQTYKISDLPQESAQDLGVDTSNPNAEIDLYRPPEEVFNPDTLKSAEGRPVTDNHPPDFVDPDNFTEYARGHLQNVRRGKEPLDSGDWPMIADIIIAAEPLLSKVKNKQARELSLGYDYGIARDGDKILQTDMVINHLAVVPKGRAGPEARIMDAAPAEESPPEVQATAPPAVERAATEPTSTAVPTKKETKPVSNIIKHLLGLGLKQYATTETDPEKLAEAAEALNQKPLSVRARAADAAEEEDEPVVDRRKGKDRKKGKDDLGDEPDEDIEPVDDKRKKMHDALDAMLDRKGKDADMEELRSLLDEFLSEEETEPQHAAEEDAGDVGPLEEVIAEETDGEELCPECGMTEDACECEADDEEEAPGEAVVESGEEELEAEDRRKAHDRGRASDAVAGSLATLKVLRPFVARSNDRALKNTFNNALSVATRRSVASMGGYGAFAGAARARDRAPKNDPRARAADSAVDPITDRNNKLQAAYDSALKGGK
jgi:hypothetical protein